MMGCIKDLEFTVLVNGSPTGWFKSTIGLRQGDLLPPYLFILGSEVLTKLLKSEQNRRNLTDFYWGAGQQHISHSLYADDCLIAVRATLREATVVNGVLKEYCKLSQQQVNYSKSNVVFGAGVLRRLRYKIMNKLEMVKTHCPI